jgi:hypothetical protein
MSVFGYGLEPYGYGPYGGLGGVSLPATTPPLGGYGGYAYGTSSYGALGGFGKPSIAITGGYGGCAYGTSPYGCIDSLSAPPEVIAAISITGFIIEVFFSQEMSPDADLFDPASYTLIDVTGAAPAVVLSVEEGVPGTWGPTSVILNHTGTTLGGLYTVVVVGPRDIGGTAIAAYAPLNQANVLCKGEPPPFTITPESGTELRYDFEYDMLDEAGFTPGIEELDAYGFITTFPQAILPQLVTFPYNADLKQLKLDVLGMTSAAYTGVVSPATAISYDATFLPNAPQADFTGQELGSGTTIQGTDEILLSKLVGFSYGWRFLDTSGKILPDSSYRVDVTFDASAAAKIDPAPGTDPVVIVLINDGLVEVDLAFKRVAGIDTLEIESGAFSASSSIDWTTQEVVVSLARNQKADTYTVVVNGEPIVAGPTASFTAAAGFPAGVQFMLDPNGVHEIIDFPLKGILFTATQTVFSAAWNFLHNQGAPFVGSGANAKDFLLTQKGPLVKGWGDATPATKQDVVVYVNGTPVEVESVNPYYGKIFLVIPIPLMPPGVMDVAVDYIWFPSPIMAMAGLNTLGVVLNKYDCKPLCPTGGNSNGVGLPGGGTNGLEFSRFPMGLVLGPGGPDIRKPLLRSPRFVAFQKPYTASLNSPTTLLLNRNPHQVALSNQERDGEGQIVFYEGVEDPVDSDPVWDLVGTNELIDTEGTDGAITVDPSNIVSDSTAVGIYQIYKQVSGPFGEGDVTFYTREIDTSFDSSLVLVARFQVLPSENLDGDPIPIPDGVFVGVGFGCHTNDHLYLMGCLLINDVQHVGMLVDPSFPEKEESWELAYQTPIEVVDATTFTTDSDALPQLIRERVVSDDLVRFQILQGTQAGVYEVIEIIDQTDGTSTVTIDGANPFPTDPSVFGNRDFTVVFEARWDGDEVSGRPVTYRLVVKNDVKTLPEGYAELFVGSSFAGPALQLQGAPPFAIPPDGVLLYPTGEDGEVFWGSLDRRASNLANWHFVRYALDPAVTTTNFRQIVVAAEMNDLPEDDPNNVWFLTQEFGSRIIDSTGDQLLLKDTSSDNQIGVEDQDLSIGYARVEPFLTRRLAIDVDTTFLIDSGVLGAGDLIYSVKDGTREVRLANILYQESATERSLLFLENVSLSGLLLPDQQGWFKVGELGTERVQGQRLQFVQAVGETVLYTLDILQAGATSLAGDGRIIESRIKVDAVSTTDVDGDTGIFFGSDAGPIGTARGVGIQLRVATGAVPDQVFLFSLETGLEVAAFDVAWNDGAIHTYRVIADTDVDVVTLVVDDVVLGTADLTLFALSSTDTQATLGFASAVTSSTVEIEDMSAIVAAPSTAMRTLGVWLGGDVDDIDRWQIPRTDGTDAPNSSLTAVVEEMDWRVRIQLRIHRDPGWGVTILRTDLPPPPYFTGNFATQFTEPSAGWINVEYPHLPRVPDGEVLGFVSFGSLDPRSISQSRIDEVRYRIYQYASENIIMPPHMVLNQQNVITSGEFGNDITVEEIVVTSTNATTVSLTSGNVTADRVFQLISQNEDGTTTTYLPGSFTFDKATQIVTITSEQFLGQTWPQDDPLPDVPNIIDGAAPHETLLLPAIPVDGVINPDPRVDALNPIHIPVTVSFAPGPPFTLTYICDEPLLDGTTLLNEGTPPFETSQVMKDEAFLAWGSRINDPNDLLNTDPDFILNDPFRFRDFRSDPTTQFEDIDFCEVSEGEECRLSPFCDDSIPGANEAGGSGNEPGDIGNGLIDIGLEGLAFTETEPIDFNDGPTDGFGKFTSTTFLKHSGGDAAPGGNLNEAVLFTPLTPETPQFQSPDGSVGWSVFGQLYDTLTDTTTNIFFGTESLGP